MSTGPVIELVPSGVKIPVALGAGLKDILFAQGFEFPCAGREECGRCRIRILRGAPDPTDSEIRVLSAQQLRDGWRLACRTRVVESLVIELSACDTPILADKTEIDLPRREGKGLVIDLGTTTLVAQLVDLNSAQVLGTRTALNPQARISADLIGRILHAFESGSGLEELTLMLREQVGGLLEELIAADSTGGTELKLVLLVGNTVMHHLFCGLSVDGLATCPFTPTDPEALSPSPSELGWDLPGDPEMVLLPCLGGFVGGDVLAGILATRIGDGDELCALIDLGTNGEVVLGSSERLLCSSAAAGPAFEGGGVSMGMRAASGAIDAVEFVDGEFRCHVIGSGTPRGICGSGLLDAVAEGLSSGKIDPSGRLVSAGRELTLEAPVLLEQRDIRELQLAKGAIAAAFECLLDKLGAGSTDVHRVYLAGAFGHRLRARSALSIGMLPVSQDRIRAVGNAALFGAKLALFEANLSARLMSLRDRIHHVPLDNIPGFQDTFVKHMMFPGHSSSEEDGSS